MICFIFELDTIKLEKVAFLCVPNYSVCLLVRFCPQGKVNDVSIVQGSSKIVSSAELDSTDHIRVRKSTTDLLSGALQLSGPLKSRTWSVLVVKFTFGHF